MGQTWSPVGSGGYLANPKLSRQIRHAAAPTMKFAQFTRPEPGFGKNKSDTIYFDRVAKVATNGGTISELAQMPETSVAITQGSVVVNEYGNSIPYTGKLEALSEFSVDNIWTKALRDDQALTLDSAIGTEFKTCKIKYTPTGTPDNPTGTFVTTGTVAATATRNTETFDVKAIVDYMKSTLFVPKFSGVIKDGYYVCIASVGFLRTIKDDDDFIEAVKYGRPEDLYYGEVGMYEGVRFIEQVNGMSDTIGAAATYKGEALFFGDDPIVEGVAIPPEIRSKTPEDYGRSKGIAWYSIQGFSLTYDTATPGEARIVHVDSL
jgi:N4-gp56 family major capsid protein